MSAQRILIVSSSPLCRNPRVLKEATTLGRSRYDVTVLTIAGRTHDETTDRALLEGAPFRKVALPYFGFDGTLGLAAHAGRTLTSIARKLVPLGIERRSALGAFHRLYAAVRRTPADLTIAHTELGLAIGSELLEHGRRVAVDFEDWHSQDLLPSARRHRPLKLLSAIEQRLLKHANYATTTSHALARALGNLHHRANPVVIANAFPLQPAPAPRDTIRPPSLFWFSQTIGPGRGLEEFIDAWLLTSSTSSLCLQGEISESYKTELLNRTRTSSKPPIVFQPLCSPRDLPTQIAKHDIGLALESQSPPSRNLTITNKILQYLNAGLAIVATSTEGHREVLQHEPRAGIFIEPTDPNRTASLLDALVSAPTALISMQAASRSLAESTYCWEREEPKLLALVEQALANRPA
ncbi:MAG: glycosyltransferase [Nibricoccus sp.]